MTQQAGKSAPDMGDAVVLICSEIDLWRHNMLFVDELMPAFAQLGIALRVLDYRTQPREVRSALEDPECRFFICFNGFGSELQVSDPQPGRFQSAFEHYGKNLFDLMHDCPAHESMAHQIESRFLRRKLLLTDYGYVTVAKALGVRHARFVSSIAFPATLREPVPRLLDRPIRILLPIGFQAPDVSRKRHAGPSYRSTIYRAIFETVAEACAVNLSLDPLHEVAAACREAGLDYDLIHPDARFLLTTVLDFVKFERRNRLMQAIAHLPVTVIAAGSLELDLPGSRLQALETRTASELLSSMAQSQSVICPLPHMTGFHERAMGAFTAGATVVAAPNHVLETNFRLGCDLLEYRTELELVQLLERILERPEDFQEMADRGRERVLSQFSPLRFAEAVVSLLTLEGG